MSPRRPRIVRHTAAGAVVAGYLLASAVVIVAHAVAPMPEWLALHLLVLGAATNAVFVWSTYFAQALLHAPSRSGRAELLRLATLNAGIVAALAGVSAGAGALALAGAGLVVAAVAAHAASLVAMVRSSPLAGPLRIVAWYYVVAGAALAAGGTIGGLLAAGWLGGTRGGPSFVLAHAELNLLGWLGLAIIGTGFMLWPMVLRTRMSDTAPRTARPVLALTAGGLAVTASALGAGPWLPAGPWQDATHWLAAAGTACYLAGAAVSLVPAVREMWAKPPRTAPAWALLAGNAWLLAAVAADVASLAAGPPAAVEVLGRLLVPIMGAGVIGQILIGALTFLLPVTTGGGPSGNRRLTAILERLWRTRAIIGNAGVLVLAVLPGHSWSTVTGWGAVVAGFGTFPPLAVAALIAAHTPAGPRVHIPPPPPLPPPGGTGPVSQPPHPADGRLVSTK